MQRGRARLKEMLLRDCEIETDRRGRVVVFETRDGEGCAACGAGRSRCSRPPQQEIAYRLTGTIAVDDGPWERVEGFLLAKPRLSRNPDRKRLDDRRAMNGIPFVFHTGDVRELD